MKIIELSEIQFKNYSKLHSSRNYKQSIEYSKVMNGYKNIYLGYMNDEDNTIMGALLLLEKKVSKFKIGYVPGSLLIDYNNDYLFKNFIVTLKNYLKEKKYVYVTCDNKIAYKIFDKKNNVIYFDTNILKILDELDFTKENKTSKQEIVLETEKTPDETYKLFNSNTKRNIILSLRRAITVYKDENNSIDTLTNLNNSIDKNRIQNILNNFNGDVKAEIYFAKIDPEKYVNNYRFLLKKEDEKNDYLNSIMQNINIKKSFSLINKKMTSDKLITKYNNEIIRATNIYTKYPEGAVVSAIMIIKNNREIYFLDEAYNKDLADVSSSHLLKWEIIKKYINEGYKIFNFGCIKDNNVKDGKYVFKIGFGGNTYEYLGTYDLIVNKWLYRIVKILSKIIK